ncbi:MAG: hypothetical protein Q9224_005904, partial [Gallowayella concinna]
MFIAPAHPPPLLNADQVLELAQTGYLPLELPPPLIISLQELLRLSTDLFSQDISTKESQFPTAQGTELGYYLVENEKEYLTLRHQYIGDTATTPVSLATAKFWTLAASFLYRILADLSTALDIPLQAWEPLLDGCLGLPTSKAEATPTLLRLFNYFPDAGAAERHTDTGFLTLCIGTASGLQVWRPCLEDSTSPPSGLWIDAGTQPTVLVGKTLQLLSAGRVNAGLHRVMTNPKGRQSVVFALRPSLRHPKLDLAPFGDPSVVNL